MLKIYSYPKCSTCKKAEKFLKDQGVEFKAVDITETPPAKSTLQRALKQGYSLKDLFNKSGVLYREMNMKDKLKTLSEKDALTLLAEHGKLIKRPIVTDNQHITVGFKEDLFKSTWL